MALSKTDRFENKYIPEPNSGCWLWVAGRMSNGYGGVMGNGAHRTSWELYRGAIPEGLSVLHKCDVKICVNPDHLFLGTQADNLADMRGKNRHGYAKRTHCRNGHEFNEQNTYYGDGRRCRVCRNGEWRRSGPSCRNGHEYTAETTRHATDSKGYGYRVCRTCQHDKYLAQKGRTYAS